MSIRNYGYAKGKMKDNTLVVSSGGPHLHIDIDAGGSVVTAAVNVESNTPFPGAPAEEASEVLYYIQENYVPDNAAKLQSFAEGTHLLASNATSGAIDMDKMSWLVTRAKMTLLPLGSATPTILHTQLNDVLQKAIDGENTVYFFGQTYAGGIHDIHKNNGNKGRFSADNGSYQDGAIFIDWGNGTWTSICIAFQTQDWATP